MKVIIDATKCKLWGCERKPQRDGYCLPCFEDMTMEGDFGPYDQCGRDDCTRPARINATLKSDGIKHPLCKICYQSLWRAGKVEIIRRTRRAPYNRGPCQDCGKSPAILTGLCIKCYDKKWRSTPKAKAARKRRRAERRALDAQRSLKYYRKNSEHLNALKRERRKVLARSDVNAYRWRRPDWFYNDTPEQRIAWAFTFDKGDYRYH